ncbi:hypothetical protein BJ508DRAFT_323780 [Ascobolus immersus RN42]|uniref:Uncharacterized protein n=1 Tax=Ascobolus immersus RN42 TaxID=1160509 RepID=A0A3N4IRB9_ASCIM|nr:hypothetical protein BJ508DRAFT_323780 [Ascobolus immersus RN42]
MHESYHHQPQGSLFSSNCSVWGSALSEPTDNIQPDFRSARAPSDRNSNATWAVEEVKRWLDGTIQTATVLELEADETSEDFEDGSAPTTAQQPHQLASPSSSMASAQLTSTTHQQSEQTQPATTNSQEEVFLPYPMDNMTYLSEYRPYNYPLRKLSQEEITDLLLVLPTNVRENIQKTETQYLPSSFPPPYCPEETMLLLLEDRLARRAEEIGIELYGRLMEVATGELWDRLIDEDEELASTLRGEIKAFLFVHGGFGYGCYAMRWESGEHWIDTDSEEEEEEEEEDMWY